MTAGSATEQCGDGASLVLERGIVVAHPADFAHGLRLGSSGCSFIRIDLAPSNGWLPSATRLVPLSPDDVAIFRCTQELRANDAARSVALRAAVLRLVAVVASADSEEPLTGFLVSARSFIEAHFAEPIALTAVARSVNVDPPRLAREFRRAYGATVGEAIRVARVRRASSMLLETACELGEIAAACGFCDASHLARSIEHAYGVRPQRFRELHGFVR